MTGAFLAVTAASQLSANSFVLASANAYDQFGGGAGNTGNSAPVPGPVAIADSGIYTDGVGNVIDAKALATYGHLSGYASSSNPLPQFQGFAISDAQWSDTFTVTGIGGGPVNILIGMYLDDSLSGSGGVQGWANLDGIGDVNDMFIHDSITTRGTTGYTDGPKVVYETKPFAIGEVVTVGEDLSTVAGPQGGSTTVDAYNTALFSLQVLTPGGGYTSENGFVFATSFDSAAPEPGTLTLLLLSGIALLASRRALFNAR